MRQGQLRRATQTYQQAARLGVVDGSPVHAAGFVGLGMGMILYEQNDLQAASRHVVEGIELLQQGKIAVGLENLYGTLARIQQALGDGKGASAAIQEAVEIAQGNNIPRLQVLISAYQARFWLAQSRPDLAARWGHEYRQMGETEYLREFEDLTLVRVLLVQNDPATALALLDALQPPAEVTGRVGAVIECLVLRAVALQASGDEGGALDALGRALRLAELEGYVRVFIDEGEPVARLLRQSVVRAVVPAYSSRLVAALESRVGGRAAEAMASLAEPLSDREMDVLALLAEGLTNPEIAQRLFISLPTVKSHTRNIYGKLDVHDRKAAVARARTLGILTS
jgi:LuxR family maltose regulon positive regulatory protein